MTPLAGMVVTTEDFVFRLNYRGGLCYLPLEWPSENDIRDLPHVNFASPGPWNPDAENDHEGDDEFYDAMIDEDELTQDKFYDSRDGWLLPDDELAAPHNIDDPTTVIASLERHIAHVKAQVKDFAARKSPIDY